MWGGLLALLLLLRQLNLVVWLKKVETSNSYYNLTSLLPSRLLLLHFLTGHDVSQNGSLGHRVSPSSE